ncbi:hypothetical protein ACFL6G_02560 [candidate division KSB1 bacterium]
MQKKPKVVVLLIGSMDSLVTVAIASLIHSLAFLHVRCRKKTHVRDYRLLTQKKIGF